MRFKILLGVFLWDLGQDLFQKFVSSRGGEEELFSGVHIWEVGQGSGTYASFFRHFIQLLFIFGIPIELFNDFKKVLVLVNRLGESAISTKLLGSRIRLPKFQSSVIFP